MTPGEGFGRAHPEVNVVVIADTGATGLEDCLAALPAALDGIGQCALAVVGDTSDASIASTVARLASTAQLIESGHQLGKAAALEAAVSELPPSAPVLFVRADVRLGPGSVVALLEALGRSGVGLAVPKVVDETGSLRRMIRQAPDRRHARRGRGGSRVRREKRILQDPAAYEWERPVEGFSGEVVLVSRNCLDAIRKGGRPFLHPADDPDLANRARRAGFLTWFTPASTVVAATRGPQGKPEPGWVCFSSVDWWYHNRAHSDIQLMRRIAADRQVLFINSIGMRMPLPGRSTQSGRRILRKVKSVLRFVQRPLPDTPGFHVATPVIIPFYGSPRIRALNARLVGAQVRAMARRIGIDLDDAVLMVTVPTAWEVVRDLPRRSLVMNRSDLHSAFEETDQHVIRRLEGQLLEHADAVIYAAHSLMDDELAQTGDRAVFLDHGVDLQHFGGDAGPEPADLAVIPRPRIGFFGGLDDYVVDLDLLERVARELPEASLVLIGDATCSMASLESRSNVHWLGFRPYEQIPAYGAGFDVALMPWLRNDWIQSSNPIKLKEYLAIGLPVVSTDFPEVHHYADSVAIAADAAEYVTLVRAALAGDGVGSVASRRARVAGASWDKRSLELLAIGEEVIH